LACCREKTVTFQQKTILCIDDEGALAYHRALLER
jgi:hypothetical protein